MVRSQARSLRKPTGSRYRALRKKRHHECGNDAIRTKISANKPKVIRVRGGNIKRVLLKADSINLIDPKTKKSLKGTIKIVIDNPANRNFVRANILTKGTIVDTDKGKARITNRPGQEGTVNGVLV
jgi:small subunit ribosomal protein S8e